jgi:lipopolysaccharide/colanic/teichoic acid biosynthesis glycosyltransferase
MTLGRERLKFGVEWILTSVTAFATVPLMGLLGLAVVATSKGGALYPSRRLGRGGRIFGCRCYTRGVTTTSVRLGASVTG